MVSEYQFLYTLYCLISKYTTHSHEIAKCKEICRLLRCIESHSHSPFAAFHFFFVCFCLPVCIDIVWYILFIFILDHSLNIYILYPTTRFVIALCEDILYPTTRIVTALCEDWHFTHMW